MTPRAKAIEAAKSNVTDVSGNHARAMRQAIKDFNKQKRRSM
jgi:hypothetical protein